jgi:hypothetical protein
VNNDDVSRYATCQFLIGLHVSYWTSVKSTNSQLRDGLIRSFIQITGTPYDKNQNLGKEK